MKMAQTLFSVSAAALVGQGRREWQTLAGILARLQGGPACQGCGNGSWGALPLKALASIRTRPCSSTHNYASKSHLVQDIFAGRPSRASQAFFTEMDFLLCSPWKWLTDFNLLHIADHQFTPRPKACSLSQFSLWIPPSIQSITGLLETVRLDSIAVQIGRWQMGTMTKEVQVNVLILNMAEIRLKILEIICNGPVLQWKSPKMEQSP